MIPFPIATYNRIKDGGSNRKMTPSFHFAEGFLAAIEDRRSVAVAEIQGLTRQMHYADIHVEPDEWIVGNVIDEPIQFRYGCGFTIGDPAQLRRMLNEHTLDQETFERAIELQTKLKPFDTYSLIRDYSDEATNQARNAKIFNGAFWGGHQVMDYPSVLQQGIQGLEQQCWEHFPRLPYYRRDFCQALIQGCNYFRIQSDRYRDLLLDCLDAAHDDAERTHYQYMIEAVQRVPILPPQTFHQALQAVFFVHVATGADSLGRFDQYMYPFYKRDIEEERITEEDAFNLIAHFFLKINEQHDIQNMTLGGQRMDGSDGTNPLTMMCLQVMEELRMPQPNITLRTHEHTPQSIWKKAISILSLGGGLPALLNDEGYIKGLLAHGIAIEDARDYAMAGCMETVIPGVSHTGADDGVLNVVGCLDLALHDGFSKFHNKQLGCHSGDPSEFASVDDVIAALKKQIDYFLTLYFKLSDLGDRLRPFTSGYVLRSLLTQNCIDTGKSQLEGGAVYNAIQNEIVGVTNTADSLYAINEWVFRQKKMTLPELVKILDANYKDHAEIRAQLKNLPKFGNEIEEINEYYKTIAHYIAEKHTEATPLRGGSYWPGMIIFTYHEEFGSQTPASADGRYAKEVFADSIGPSQGMDHSGPTAVIHSVSQFDQSKFITTPILNMKFTPDLLHDEMSQEKILSMIKQYFRSGGMQIQINCVDASMLKQAQKNPTEYKDLIVRVGGFSAYFVTLSKAVQDDIIKRTAHGV